MTELLVSVQEQPEGITLVSLKGFLDTRNFTQLDKVLQQLFSRERYRIVIDMRLLEFISSSGAGLLVGSMQRARENNGDILLAQAPLAITETLNLLGFSHFFTFYPDSETALAQFA